MSEDEDFQVTDKMVEAAARQMCWHNGIPECHGDKEYPCTPATCGGWRDFREAARAAIEAAIAAQNT